MPRPTRTRSVIAQALALAAAALLLPAVDASARQARRPREKPEGMAMVADVVIARPLGLAVSAAGCGVFLVALPFAAAAGDVRGTAHRLVAEPLRFTFTRPLGRFR